MPISVRKRLEALVKVGTSTVWSGFPEPVSQKMVDTLAKVLDCELACVHLFDVTGAYLIRSVTYGDPSKYVPVGDMRVSITTGRMPQMMATHQPIVMDLLRPHPADQIPEILFEFKSAISVPLLAGEDMLGMYSIVYKRRQRWTKEDLDYFVDIGRLLGISVQHAQIAKKTADLDVLMERKRLCSELHDNFSQLIGSLNLGIEAAFLSLEEGNIHRLRRDLERIRHAGQEASRMLREEMLSLRTSIDETEGLIPAIRECLQRFEQQWGISTDLKVEEDLEPLFVSTQMKLQFVRILHESLSNVLRHATATHVSVRLQGNQNWLSMQIQDNGRGFDPETVSYEHLGLRIMRERAESLGGELSIFSSLGAGTTIRVNVPRYA